MTTKLSIALGSILTLQSCLPASPQPAAQQPNQDNQNTSNTQATTLKDIGASKMMVVQGSSSVSLASIAKQGSADLTVFQFAGVGCIPCQKESPIVTQSLAKYGSKVLRYIVFPNKVDAYDTSDYLGFTQQYAGNAPYVIDSTKAVLYAVRANSEQFFGIYVLVNKAGQGQILNMDDAYKQVEAAVVKALGQ